MKPNSSMLSLIGLALLGSLGIGTGTASAQSIYVETYAEPHPIVAPYPVVIAPGYVVRPVVVPPPIVRERAVVVSRSGYVPAPVLAPPPRVYAIDDW